MLINQRMDKENVVHLCNGVLLSNIKVTFKFPSKLKELEKKKKTILSDVPRPRKTNRMYSLRSRY